MKQTYITEDGIARELRKLHTGQVKITYENDEDD
jgi:hypothetical protein